MKYPDQKIEHLHLLGKLFTSSAGSDLIFSSSSFAVPWSPSLLEKLSDCETIVVCIAEGPNHMVGYALGMASW